MTVIESPRGPSASNKTMQYATSSYHRTQVKSGNLAENTGRWTKEEHSQFVAGLEAHGKEWKRIAEMITTRTVVQIRTHAQKYFQKIAKAREAQGKSIPGDLVSTASNRPSSATAVIAGVVPPSGGGAPESLLMRVRTSSTSSVTSTSSGSSASSESSDVSAVSAPPLRKAPKVSAPSRSRQQGKRAASRPKRYTDSGPSKRQRRHQNPPVSGSAPRGGGLVLTGLVPSGTPSSFTEQLARSFALKMDHQTVVSTDDYIASDASDGFLSFCDTESVMSEWLSSDDAFSESSSSDGRDTPLSEEGDPATDPLPGLSDLATPLAAWINSTENDASLALPVDDYVGLSKQRRHRAALSDHRILMAF